MVACTLPFTGDLRPPLADGMTHLCRAAKRCLHGPTLQVAEELIERLPDWLAEVSKYTERWFDVELTGERILERIANAQTGVQEVAANLASGTDLGAAVAFTLDEAIAKVMAIAEAGRSARNDVIVICHGGPFDEPENVGTALAKMPGIHGFFGASSIERLPTERAIRGQVEAFKSLPVAK